MSERLKNGLELTTAFQLAVELSDQYPVKQKLKQTLKAFLNEAEKDLAKEYQLVYNCNPEFAINAIKKKHQLIKIIAEFDEADFILCADFMQRFSDNIHIARKKGLVFFDKIL
jgi:hypothetical protein